MIGESMGQLLTGEFSREDKFPLSSAECLGLIERITAQLPVLSPQSSGTDLDLRLPQSQFWQLTRWRGWVELFYAEAIIRHGDHPGSIPDTLSFP
ncbi:hypothetical protein GCM10028825_13890 [Spirosoma agri]